MTQLTSDFFVERIKAWGVTRIYGYPGDGINGAGLGAAWERALAADRPVVLEVKTDPSAAPLPPHVTLEQAKAFVSFMAQGDRNAAQVVAETARQIIGGVNERL